MIPIMIFTLKACDFLYFVSPYKKYNGSFSFHSKVIKSNIFLLGSTLVLSKIIM